MEILESSEIKELDEHNWNLTRVKLGITDIKDARGNLPWEIGLDKLITRGKGCYPGQEIHARIDSRGSKNKTLVRIISDKNNAIVGTRNKKKLIFLNLLIIRFS